MCVERGGFCQNTGIPGCECIPTDVDELNACNDGVDNDCNGFIDCDDRVCVGSLFCVECVPTAPFENSCGDGLDNDCDGLLDCADRNDCLMDPVCLECVPVSRREFQCRDGRDDDCDGVPEVALWVGDGHPYSLPSAALTDARFGDLICVDAGTYDDTIDFDGKSLRMMGVDRDSVIVQSTVGPRFVDGENASSLLAYMTFRGIDGQSSGDKGILHISGASPVIRDVRFTDFHASSSDHFSGAGIQNSGAVLEDVVFDNISASRTGSASQIGRASCRERV